MGTFWLALAQRCGSMFDEATFLRSGNSREKSRMKPSLCTARGARGARAMRSVGRGLCGARGGVRAERGVCAARLKRYGLPVSGSVRPSAPVAGSFMLAAASANIVASRSSSCGHPSSPKSLSAAAKYWRSVSLNTLRTFQLGLPFSWWGEGRGVQRAARVSTGRASAWARASAGRASAWVGERTGKEKRATQSRRAASVAAAEGYPGPVTAFISLMRRSMLVSHLD
eukprot:scaffold99171_cov69-Phaeocystis_antarctica.AAC.1